jgi:hypothetical protein
MSLFDLIVLALATYRLSSLLVDEEGPWELFERLRALAGMRYDALSRRYGTNQLSQALTCVWCTSVWVGGALALAYYVLGVTLIWLALPFALSAVACLLDARTNAAA